LDLEIAGRAYFVTGGSKGVGRAVVEALLEEGASVGTCARDRVALHDELGGHSALQGGRLLLHVADVRNSDAVAKSVADTAQHFGRLDGVIANAGAGVTSGVLDAENSVWTEQLDIKIFGTLNTVRPAVSHLAESDAGRVVVINGVTAHLPQVDMPAVSATRAALLNLTRSLAVELAAAGICVNALNLGAIATARQRARHAAVAGGPPFEQWTTDEVQRRGILLGRLGTPSDVAPAVLFLLSPLAGYITGTSIDIAGGGGRPM
jgi:NAD(P)-dependent dehydrogenase (short-subunit alcohol dehydrogenase family)